MAASGPSLFSLCSYIENLKNLLVRNHWTDFHIILQKCSFGDPLPRLFKPFGFVKKHSRQGGWGGGGGGGGAGAGAGAGLIFPIYLYRKLEKSSCQKLLDRFPYNFCRNVPLVILLQDCSSHLDSSKTGPRGGGGWGGGGWGGLWAGLIFPIYLYRKLKKSSCQKPLERLQYNVAEMFLC